MIRKTRPLCCETDPLTERHLRRAGVPAKAGSGSIWKPFATRIRSQAAQTAPPATQPRSAEGSRACLQRDFPSLVICFISSSVLAPPPLTGNYVRADPPAAGRVRRAHLASCRPSGGKEPAPHVFTSSSYLACLAKKEEEKKRLGLCVEDRPK